jgi:hypothetical protein
MDLYGPDQMTGVDLYQMSAFFRWQLPSSFLCGCALVPSLWLKNGFPSEAFAL